MARNIRLPQLPWHGPKDLELALPDTWRVEVCNMAGYDRPALNEDQIRVSITSPIGTPPIRELAKGKNEVVILFDDMTRPTRVERIAAYVLEELAQAGIPDRKIRFIAATGCHGAMDRIDFAKKLGEAVLARFPVYNHNPYENCTYVGTTSHGSPVLINAEFMHCDFKIAIGLTCPHLFVGFAGGGKMIVPGVAHVDTIAAIHSPRAADQALPNSDVNPARLEIDEAAQMVGLDVVIECLVNQWGDTAAIFAGALTPAYEASVQEARAHYSTTRAKDKDIVIANTFAKANEALIALQTAGSVRGSGGDLVLIANAPEGQVVHYLFGSWGRTIGGRLRLTSPIPPQVNRLIVYSEYPDLAGLGFFQESPRLAPMNDWGEVLQTLQRAHAASAAVAVYPNADIQYFG